MNMKRIARKLLFIITALLCVSETFAQLSIHLNVGSHPDPVLSDWASNKTIAFVTVTNAGKKPVSAIFDCQISKDGVTQAYTKRTSMPITVIPPGATIYYGDQLLPPGDVSYSGNNGTVAAKTGMLPAGNYEFCVAFLTPGTFVPLTTQPSCKMFTLTAYQSPILQEPLDGSQLNKTNRPTFRWTGVSPAYYGPVTYRIVVLEVLTGQTPTTAFQSNQPILDLQTSVTNLLWPPDYALPEAGKTYVWGVYAYDQNHNPIGDPKGFSGIYSFTGCCK